MKQVMWSCEIAKTFWAWVSVKYNALFVLHWKGELFGYKCLIWKSHGIMGHDPTNGKLFFLETMFLTNLSWEEHSIHLEIILYMQIGFGYANVNRDFLFLERCRWYSSLNKNAHFEEREDHINYI